MLKIGITGGMGSGKSTVCNIFQHLGIPVYSADARAKQLMQEDTVLISEIKKAFGVDVYSEGRLDRKKLADIVFIDKEKVKKLNSLVHPAVFRDFDRWVSEQKAPYVLKEAALMFESDSYKDQDFVITVSAPKELRIQRVLQRDQSKREEIEARMANQWMEEQRLAKADYVIHNDGNEPLIPQVLALHETFLEKVKLK